MKYRLLTLIAFLGLTLATVAQDTKAAAAPAAKAETTQTAAPSNDKSKDSVSALAAQAADSLGLDSASVAGVAAADSLLTDDALGAEGGIHKALKTKFIEGNALFMSLVALALVLGLAFCIERIIFLSLADIDTKDFLRRFREKAEAGDEEGAKALCDEAKGPVPAIAAHALQHRDEEPADLERTITSYAETMVGKLEKGCSWITLFIAIAPSLGFLGTVIGMVMAFDQIQTEGDITPTIVASGMKVALITTIFGIIVAVVLQIFYNYILSRIEHLTSQMEQSAMEIMEIVKR